MPIKTNGVNKPKPPHQSSRIRCADKILTQLEIHADAVLAQNTNNVTNRNAKLSSLKNHVDPSKRNAILFGDMADRANANPILTRNSSLDESLDNMKISSKPRKSVTFKDC